MLREDPVEDLLRQELSGAGEVVRRIDTKRHRVDDRDVDAHAVLDGAELFELLAQFQR